MRIVLPFLLLGVASCAFYPISDSFSPYIALQGHSAPIVWHSKSYSLAMAQSGAVRINSRGVQFIPPASVQIVFNDRSDASHSLHSIAVSDDDSTWSSQNCSRSQSCLCRTDDDIRYFPIPPHPVVVRVLDGLEDGEISPSPDMPSCSGDRTGRTFQYHTDAQSRHAREDLSLCNILTGGGDFVYVTSSNTIYTSHSIISTQILIVIGLLTVYMAVVLANNVEYILKASEPRNNIVWTQASVIALVIVLLFASGTQDSLGAFITLEDRLGFVILISYVGYHTAVVVVVVLLGGGGSKQSAISSPVNPILCTLALASMRIHNTMDNTYTLVVAFLVATRTLNKSSPGNLSVTVQPSPVMRFARVFDVVMDALVLAVLIYVGVIPFLDRDPMISFLYVLQGGVVAILLDQTMQRFETAK